MTIKPSGLLHIHDVAGLLACTDRHVRNLISKKELEAVKIGKRSRRVKKESVIKFLEKNIVNPEDFFK